MLVTLCAWPPLSAAQWVILSRFLYSFHSLPVCLAWLALSALLFLHFYVAGRRVAPYTVLSCRFISCLYVQRCIFYSDLFIWNFLLRSALPSVSCDGICKFTHFCSAFFEMKQCDVWEKKPTEGECDCKHRANNVLYLLVCVVCAVHWHFSTHFMSASSTLLNQADDKQKRIGKTLRWTKNGSIAERIYFRERETWNDIVSDSVVLTLYLCVNFFQKKFSLHVCTVHGLSGLSTFLSPSIGCIFVCTIPQEIAVISLGWTGINIIIITLRLWLQATDAFALVLALSFA